MNTADNSGHYVFPEQHCSPESQENPNAMLELITSVDVTDNTKELMEFDKTSQSEYAFLLSNFNLIYIFFH